MVLLCPPGVTASRTGGDEFVLLGPLDVHDTAALAALLHHPPRRSRP